MIDASSPPAPHRRHGFLRGLGFKHYQAAGPVDDNVLRENYIDRIYDTYIDEEELQDCDHTILEIANRWSRAAIPRASSSGRWASGCRARATPRSPAR
jgi:deoxyhypusine synthase